MSCGDICGDYESVNFRATYENKYHTYLYIYLSAFSFCFESKYLWSTEQKYLENLNLSVVLDVRCSGVVFRRELSAISKKFQLVRPFIKSDQPAGSFYLVLDHRIYLWPRVFDPSTWNFSWSPFEKEAEMEWVTCPEDCRCLGEVEYFLIMPFRTSRGLSLIERKNTRKNYR